MRHWQIWPNRDFEKGMLTDEFNNIQSGRLNPNIHLPDAAKLALVDFIADELPRWRDDSSRPTSHAETTLTEHLCDYLNSAVYYSDAWSHVQFRTETRDEKHGGRKIDLTVKPCAATLIIGNRRYSHYDSLFPIECKRLPTPHEKGRDEREYVTTEPGTTGGIQRFKFGYHGAEHSFGAMIAYVQEKSLSHWQGKVNCWIQELSTKPDSFWSHSDILHMLSDDTIMRLGKFKSNHERIGDLDDCVLHHLWIRMN